MRKSVLLFFLIIILVLGMQVVTSGYNEVDFTINGQSADFSLPVMRDSLGHLYAPMTEFFEKTNIQYLMLPEQRVLVFRDNIFIKFQLQYNTFELNGKEFTWDTPPFQQNGEYYISLDEMIKYMNFTATFNEDENLVNLTTGSVIDRNFLGDFYAKRIDDAITGLTFDVDYFWQREGNGFRGDYGSYFIYLETTRLDAPPFTDFDEFVDEYLYENIDEYPEYGYLTTRSFTGRFTDGDIYTYRKNLPEEAEGVKTEYVSFAFFSFGGEIFQMRFTSNAQDRIVFEEVQSRVLNTVKSRQFNVDTKEEHYIEYNNFFEQETFIESPIYSNILIKGGLPFKGLINERINYLDVRVTKQNRIFNYRVDVNNGRFDDTIPIPFDLGFHQVSILMPPEVLETTNHLGIEHQEHLLMQFSVLNQQAGMGLYVSSSTEVDTRDPIMIPMLQELPLKTTNRDQASLAFDLLKQYHYNSDISSQKELLEKGEGNSHAISTLFAAMLRAYQIPTRIITDAYTETYYVEFQSNGNWVFNDPTSFVRGLRSKEEVFHQKRPDKITFIPLDY